MRLVYICWQDAYGTGGAWEPLGECSAEPLMCHSIGWVVDESPTDIMLVQTLAVNKGDEDSFFNRIDIPRGMILNIRDVPGYDIGQ